MLLFFFFFLFVFRLEFVADKHGVQVISEVDIVDGKMCMHVDSAEVHEWSVFIKNTGQHVVDFTYYSPLHWMQCFSFDDSQKVTRLKPLSLHPGENKSFFHFQTQSISRLEICLQLFDSTCWVYQAKCMMSWWSSIQSMWVYTMLQWLSSSSWAWSKGHSTSCALLKLNSAHS